MERDVARVSCSCQSFSFFPDIVVCEKDLNSKPLSSLSKMATDTRLSEIQSLARAVGLWLAPSSFSILLEITASLHMHPS